MAVQIKFARPRSLLARMAGEMGRCCVTNPAGGRASFCALSLHSQSLAAGGFLGAAGFGQQARGFGLGSSRFIGHLSPQMPLPQRKALNAGPDVPIRIKNDRTRPDNIEAPRIRLNFSIITPRRAPFVPVGSNLIEVMFACPDSGQGAGRLRPPSASLHVSLITPSELPDVEGKSPRVRSGYKHYRNISEPGGHGIHHEHRTRFRLRLLTPRAS